MTRGPTMASYSYSFYRCVCVFFETLSFANVCVTAVVVTRGVVNGSTLVFFRRFVFRVYYHRTDVVSRLVVHVHVV